MRRPFRYRVTWILCLGLVWMGFMAVGWGQGTPPTASARDG